MSALPIHFTGVTVVTKANVFFDGKVVSHSVLFPNGAKKTLGVVFPGSFHFHTAAPERMEITHGTCRVILDGAAAAKDFGAGEHFDVPANSGFSIEVSAGICEYICSFL